MKKIFTKAIFSAVIISCCAFLPADDCTMYVPAKAGSEMEYKSFTEDGKVTGRNVTKILAVRKTAGGQEIDVQAETFDKKDKATGTATYVMTCDKGVFSVDMQSMVTKEQKESFKDAKVTITSDKLEVPANPQAGQTLKDGTFKMTSVTDDNPIGLNLIINVTNRKVAAIEDITVPAGTFKCVKITSDVETRLLFSIKSKIVEWYAKDIGVVKSEIYDKKDRLQGYTVLNSKK